MPLNMQISIAFVNILMPQRLWLLKFTNSLIKQFTHPFYVPLSVITQFFTLRL